LTKHEGDYTAKAKNKAISYVNTHIVSLKAVKQSGRFCDRV